VQLIGTLADGKASSGLFTQTQGAGDAGNLRIATGQLIVRDGAQVSSSTFDEGQGGRLTVRASDSVQLIGSSAEGTSSGLFAVTKGGSGAAGDLRISTGRLIVRDGAQVSASNFGTGQGRRGNLTVRASESVELNGISANSPLRSGLFVGTAGIEDAGDLTIDTGRLVVRDGAVVSAGSRGQGNGGTLTVRASESVQLLGTSADGKPSSLLTQASDTGSAGNLTIETEQLIVRDGAGVTVSSEGSGDAGELQIQARSITLDNKAALSATTRSGNGGDITLSMQDLLLLRRNSEISTTAGIAGDGGNGGNIIIDAKDGFIVAIPEENSDIKANAFTGRGGTVQITAQGIFGLVPRSLEELKTLLGTDDPNQLDPARLPSDDITAISQTDPALSGQVTINTPDVDPSRGLVALPTEVVDASRLVASGCGTPQRIAQSKFIITGRGGLPPSPSDTLSSDAVWSDLRSHTQQAENQPSAAVATQTTDPTTAPLVEAQGWVINDKGQVVLTATAPTVTPHNPWQTPAACRRS
jgi:large exoprotein involved in heme utilization and adhesion